MTKTLQELKNTPFNELTSDEKQRLISITEKEAAATTGRDASIKDMMADIMKQCR